MMPQRFVQSTGPQPEVVDTAVVTDATVVDATVVAEIVVVVTFAIVVPTDAVFAPPALVLLPLVVTTVLAQAVTASVARTIEQASDERPTQ